MKDVETVPVTLDDAELIAHGVNLLQHHFGIRTSQKFATDDDHRILRRLDRFARRVLTRGDFLERRCRVTQVLARVGKVGFRSDARDGGAAGDHRAT